MPRQSLALPLLACAVAAGPVPQPAPGEIRIFRDWAVGCDNAKACTIASLGPASGSAPAITMNATIAAGPAREVRILFASAGDTPPATGVRIDGRSFGGLAAGTKGSVTSGAAADAILFAIANGKGLAAIDAGGRTVALSTGGIAAALRYVDAVQGRAGTTGALVTRGTRPIGAIPPAPALPQLSEVSTEGRAALPTAAQVAALARSAGCAGPAGRAQTFALGEARALVLVPCRAGAYNLSSAVFVIFGGKPRPATFDAPPGFGEGGVAPLAVNATYRDGVLTSHAKGRGLGDCGTLQRFLWDGGGFRLIEQAAMTDCRGNPNLITTWRVRVVRRAQR